LPGRLVRAFRNIPCAATLDRKHEIPDVGSRKSVDGFVAEQRKNVCFQTA
jgi:hypothetical protein